MKWALILGASGGIGQQISADLAKRGWSLYLQGNQHLERLKQKVKTWQQKYPQQDFLLISADFRQETSVDKVVQSIFSLDALIAAQGATTYGLFSQLSSENLTQLLNINVRVPLLIIQHLQAKLAHTAAGRIILIGSVYGRHGSAMEVAYSMTKGALSAFAKAYAQEIASLGITINVLAPGAVATTMLDRFSPANLEYLLSQIPTGRLAQGKDISYWVQILLNKKSQYLTGQTLYITGGWLE